MPVRVRYRANELSEGVVEVFHEANAYTVDEEQRLLLQERWEEDDEDTGKTKKRQRQVGCVHPTRWDSVVVMEEAEA